MNADYFHLATFESPSTDPWGDWKADSNGATLGIYQEEDGNHFVAFAPAISFPHGPVLFKELQGLEPDREYCLSLRTRQQWANQAVPVLTWKLGDEQIAAPIEVTTSEWITLHWRFKASQAVETLKLEVRERIGDPSHARGNLAIDDIRIYPSRFEEDFNDLPQQLIQPGGQLALKTMLVTLLPTSLGPAGIHRYDSDEPGMREKQALGLSIGKDMRQYLSIDLPGEFTSIRFAWTWLQKDATVQYLDQSGATLDSRTIHASAGRDQWVEYQAENESQAVSRIELTYSDYSFLDFFTLQRL
ncbi:hypothetical protein [Pseudomonas sp. SWRI77]|uniref:hypothetical protein n=1 Tax=Pseudomonas sp. SWRI77 TaxID=2745485 RepID=UPI001645198D|nr:hypothetical protein [Pseudomonas sp. SWRI77]MBC3482654.1 hypothetical protein [Pseudomonas sp. SWRI77]